MCSPSSVLQAHRLKIACYREGFDGKLKYGAGRPRSRPPRKWSSGRRTANTTSVQGSGRWWPPGGQRSQLSLGRSRGDCADKGRAAARTGSDVAHARPGGAGGAHMIEAGNGQYEVVRGRACRTGRHAAAL